MTITAIKPAHTAPQPAPLIPPSPARIATTTDQSTFYAAVNLTGRLSVLDAPANAAGLAPLSRRTTTGLVYRIDLDHGITCWLDGDHQHGAADINPIATHLCAALSTQPYTDPWDAPFVCGPVVFTGTDGSRLVALNDAQLTRLVDAHADAEEAEEASRTETVRS